MSEIFYETVPKFYVDARKLFILKMYGIFFKLYDDLYENIWKFVWECTKDFDMKKL